MTLFVCPHADTCEVNFAHTEPHPYSGTCDIGYCDLLSHGKYRDIRSAKCVEWILLDKELFEI